MNAWNCAVNIVTLWVSYSVNGSKKERFIDMKNCVCFFWTDWSLVDGLAIDKWWMMDSAQFSLN